MSKVLIKAVAIAAALTLSACSQGDESAAPNQTGDNATNEGSMEEQAGSGGEGGSGSPMAVAELSPTKDFDVKGEVTFSQADEGVRVMGSLTGLEPGKHGFHVHAKGDCSAPDGKSAGGHFNPTDAKHGAPEDNEHHVGDLGNIDADDSGKAEIGGTYKFLSLSGDNSIMGKAVIVHAGADDLESQPSGDAGARVACGVIEKAQASGQ